jgi:hypothetical protein
MKCIAELRLTLGRVPALRGIRSRLHSRPSQRGDSDPETRILLVRPHATQ